MNKHKYLPCFNCYKYSYDTGVRICFASFPCYSLADKFIIYYMDHLELSSSGSFEYYIKKESVAKFL